MIFDTDVLIWALRGNTRAANAIDRAEDRFLSVVSYMELARGARGKKDLRLIRNFFSDIDFLVLPLSENIGHRASIYVEEYALKSNIGLPDALIAATAIENDQALCTANHKDYRMITECEIQRFRP